MWIRSYVFNIFNQEAFAWKIYIFRTSRKYMNVFLFAHICWFLYISKSLNCETFYSGKFIFYVSDGLSSIICKIFARKILFFSINYYDKMRYTSVVNYNFVYSLPLLLFFYYNFALRKVKYFCVVRKKFERYELV